MRPTPDPVGPGQESVWDYPRPPSHQPAGRSVRVEHAGHVVAKTDRAVIVRETAGPPTYYIPRDDVDGAVLSKGAGRSHCEWKGRAAYYDLAVPGADTVRDAAWWYPEPNKGWEDIRDHIAFYASRVDACFVDGERVTPQPGGFYGGWITKDVVGPFKGEPGSEHW